MRRNDENTLYFDSTTDSEPVHFNGVLGDTLLREEVGYLETLITLQLNDFARLLIIDEGTVASKFLLECLEQFLRIVLLGQTLQGCQSLSTISLLNTNMDVVLLRPNVLGISKLVSFVCEGVESIEVLHAHATV